MEPNILLKQISNQMSAGYIMITDPYDYERGINSVKHPINELVLRKNLRELKFKNKQRNRKALIHTMEFETL